MKAIEIAKKGKGPVFIECRTYRWLGHHIMDQDKKYRRSKEVEEWKDKCPIKRIEKTILKRNILSRNQIKQIQAKTLSRVNIAANKALESDYPSVRLLQDFINT